MSNILTATNGLQAIIDKEDYEWALKLKWYDFGGYLNRSIKIENEWKTISLHREIMIRNGHDIEGKLVDHINGDTLNNTKENLRVANRKENTINSKKMNRKTTSIYKGVSYDMNMQSWRSKINDNFLGYFEDETIAANVYNHFAKEKYGEYARLNDIEFIPLEECMKQRRVKIESSIHKGISLHKSTDKWRVILHIQGKKKYLGAYETEEKALDVRNEYLLNNPEIRVKYFPHEIGIDLK